MRCFIALDLPEKIKDYLESLQKNFGSISGKFVEINNLHLTLRFLGEIKESQVNLIKEKLSKIKFESFKVKLGGLGVFPSRKFAKIVWVSLEPANKIIELKDQIDFALKNMDFSEDKKFKSHITLIRIKSIKDKKRFFDVLDKIKIEPLEFKVDSFVFKKSVLAETGPEYFDLFTQNNSVQQS